MPADALAASLRCTNDVTDADTTPVLLLPATAVNSTDNFSWNYERALTDKGISWCTSDVPAPEHANANLADIQTRAEYVTYAIYRLAGRRISTLGHSQGGMIARWSLRFWPDTREMVDDVIGMAPSNHGTSTAHATCVTPSSPAIWQQRSGSRFNDALDSYQEAFVGISYTTIPSDFDEVIVPPGNSAPDGPGRIANLRVQDRCPARPVEHLQVGTSDPVVEGFVFDALRHNSPAHIARVDQSVCLRASCPASIRRPIRRTSPPPRQR
ncbi:MAG: lipase [Actinophytocola sp.]|nr:lipase [Actinophytocola sp.]